VLLNAGGWKQEKAIAEAEATTAKMEKYIPAEEEVLEKMYESTKEETDALRAKLDKAQEELLPWSALFLKIYVPELCGGGIMFPLGSSPREQQSLWWR
jgi:hypothetical protein